jgi:hypothetical protein
MTYDQNTRLTEPGPVAGYVWTQQQMEYALQFVPKEKLSLGIPIYDYHWFAGDPGSEEQPNPTAEYIGQQEVEEHLGAYHPRNEWDSFDRVAWFYLCRDDNREWVFHTEKRGFQERLNLARERQLQGFCSWVLGVEDPEIWTVLTSPSKNLFCLSLGQGMLGGRDGFIYIFFGVGRAQERGLILRGWQIDTTVEHAAKKLPKRFRVRLGCGIPIRDRTGSKEPGEHRTDAIGGEGNAGVCRCRSHSFHQLRTQTLDAGINLLLVVAQLF